MTILERIRRQSAGRVAIEYMGQTMTYGELCSRTQRLAARLASAGAGPERIVAIFTDPCPEMVVAILATLWTGSAYLPLDPAYPPSRLRAMMDQASPVITVCARESGPRVDEQSLGVRGCLFVDEDTAADAQLAPREVRSENLAYVIFTSGSTGAPKGVMVTHAGITSMVCAQIELFAINPDSRILQCAAFSFDASVSEVFTALAAGARLCLAPRSTLLPGAPLSRALRDLKISTVTLTPTVLATTSPDQLTHLATIISAGEACSQAIVERWSPNRRFINAYGPTEATVCATAGVVPEGGAPTIGLPLPHVRVYVLDDNLSPVPTGQIGQLFIAGECLARGYLGRPAQTAALFVPDPWGPPGTRMYCTGDLVQQSASGDLRYVGRNDAQVKVRGYRIELEEIEHVLRRDPDVRDALVTTWTDPSGDARLVAYVVPHADAAVTDIIRTRARDSLPEFMVPWRVIPLREWPRSPNGKIDRKALPSPEALLINARDSITPPRDRTELALVEIWEAVIGRAPIGIDDDFFDLGGTSLMALQVVDRIQKQLDVSCEIELLGERPTIKKLAEHIRNDLDPDSTMAGAASGRARPTTTLLRSGRNDAPRLFLFPPIHGSPLCFVPLARLLTTDHAVYGLRAPGLRNERTPPTRIDELAAYYVNAIRAVQPEGPYTLAGWSLGGLVAFEAAQQLDRAGEQIASLTLVESNVPGALHTAWLRKHKEFTVPVAAQMFVRNMAWTLGLQGEITHVDYSSSSPKQILHDVLERLVALEVVTPTTSLTYIAALLTVFRNTITAFLDYQQQTKSKYPHDIVVFTAEDGHPGIPKGCPVDTWEEFSTGKIEYLRAPGNHFTICHPRNVARLASQLSAVLAR